MHLLLVKYTLVMYVTKIVDCSIAGWAYMDPIRQQMSPYGPYRSRCNEPSKNLYWYPRPTSNLSHQLQYQQGRPQSLNPWPAPPPPLYSWPAQPQPPTSCLTFPLSTPCLIITLVTPCPLPHYSTTSQPINYSTQVSNKPPHPTNPTTILPLLSTSTIKPSNLPQPLISNIVPAMPQSFLQLTNLPNNTLPFPMSPPLSIPPAPQIGIIPGLPGLVSSDGGINIMPFSDVYTDLYEKFKNKVARKELRKLRKLIDYKKIKDNAKLKEYTMEIESQEESEEEEENDETLTEEDREDTT